MREYHMTLLIQSFQATLTHSLMCVAVPQPRRRVRTRAPAQMPLGAFSAHLTWSQDAENAARDTERRHLASWPYAPCLRLERISDTRRKTRVLIGRVRRNGSFSEEEALTA
ncbi:hypothetical protein FRC12_020337, partial [Ceratobasidium sp. 428]